MSDVTRRALLLLSLLQRGHSWPGDQLARRLEVSPRTLRRDVERLVDLGYEITSRTGPGGHYRLAASATMPPLLLDDDEAIAVAVGLRLAADAPGLPGTEDGVTHRALEKMHRILPPRLQPRIAELHQVTESSAGRHGPAPDPSHLRLLAAAAAAHERVDLDYQGRTGAAGRREVEPHRLLLRERRWYLLAYDLHREDWRTFRVDRIRDATPTRLRFRPRPLPAPTAADFMHDSLTAQRHHAVLTFDASLDAVVDRLTTPAGRLEALDAERCRFETWVDSYEWLAIHVAVLGLDFTIDQPAEFRAAARTMGNRLARAGT